MGLRHLSKNISVRSLTLLIFAVGWALVGIESAVGWALRVWLTTTQTRVSDAIAVTFSVKCVKCFNP